MDDRRREPGRRSPLTARAPRRARWSTRSAGPVLLCHGDVSRTTKGEQVTRHGSDDDPAYVIEQEEGTVVLKLASEVSRAAG
ncbi:HVA1 family protein [Nocardioides solisilvae]|uniref:HVA1 family protein n=1 Tax=Nocardioides solisilvae TaxID=1542435 RepID=UPI00194F4FDF